MWHTFVVRAEIKLDFRSLLFQVAVKIDVGIIVVRRVLLHDNKMYRGRDIMYSAVVKCRTGIRLAL